MKNNDFPAVVEWFCGQMADVQSILAMADGKTGGHGQDCGGNKKTPQCPTSPPVGDRLPDCGNCPYAFD